MTDKEISYDAFLEYVSGKNNVGNKDIEEISNVLRFCTPINTALVDMAARALYQNGIRTQSSVIKPILEMLEFYASGCSDFKSAIQLIKNYCENMGIDIQ